MGSTLGSAFYGTTILSVVLSAGTITIAIVIGVVVISIGFWK